MPNKLLLVMAIGLAACGGQNAATECSLGAEGAACATSTDCCSNDCSGGSCGAVGSCTATGLACTDAASCCSGACESGTCTPVSCAGVGTTCATAGECCTGRCDSNVCLPTNSCLAPNADCVAGAMNDCCSGRCEPLQGMTGVTRCTNFCRGNGAACQKAVDCCDLNCNNGVCGGEICAVQSDDCTSNAQCCSNICAGDRCQLDPANTMCRGVGETCNSGSQQGCCSMVCDVTQNPPRCDFGPGVCKAQNAGCTMDSDCCHGICDPQTKLCATPCTPTGGTCTTGPDCCSSVCTNGSCAPPPACDPIGTGCTTDAQCCTGLCLGGFCDQIL